MVINLVSLSQEHDLDQLTCTAPVGVRIFIPAFRPCVYKKFVKYANMWICEISVQVNWPRDPSVVTKSCSREVNSRVQLGHCKLVVFYLLPIVS